MLEGKNILLRPLKISDLYFLEHIENNNENWKYGSEKKKYNWAELEDYIKKSSTDISIAKQYRFVIDLHNTPIGFIDLYDYTENSAGIGIIVAKDYRNKGFAKEALSILIDYSFYHLNITQLNAIVEKKNQPSIKLFFSCNFRINTEKENLKYFTRLAKN